MQEDVVLSASNSSHQSLEQEGELPHLRTKQKKKRIVKTPLVVNLSDCKYVVVKVVVKSLKMNSIRDFSADWDLNWTDSSVTPQTLSKMKAYQKINHLPGMFQLSRKNYLARNIQKMRKMFPQEYNFHPRTWALPAEFNDLKNYIQNQNNPVVIAKPEAGCQGRGIFLSKNIEQFTFGQHYVVQKYLKKPLLIQGLKFDLRVYVLVTGCDPLRLFIYRQGLARFATEGYCAPKKQNLNNLFMHLTNYAINKVNAKFQFNQSSERMDIGHKRSLTSVLKTLKEMGKDTEAIWQNMCQIIVKTVISVQPILAHTYRSCQPENLSNNMCFQLLGFDIILDNQLRPTILEVNYTPSFATDTPLDLTIKQKLIRDTLLIMNLSNKAKNEALNVKKKEMAQRTLTGKKYFRSKEERQVEIKRLAAKRDRWQADHLGHFQPIYPPQQPNLNKLYQEFMSHSEQCYLNVTGGNIKRQAKVATPSIGTTETNQSVVQPKYNKTHQLERIYMKKYKPMGSALKTRGNRSQLKEEVEDIKEQLADSKYHFYPNPKQFARGKAYDSVEKLNTLKQEHRAVTSQKGRPKEEQVEQRGGTAKPSKSALSRVYNTAFREMRACR